MNLTKIQLEGLQEWVAGLPKVTSGPHRFGGVEFRVDGLGFMHFHGQTHLDIRLSKQHQAQVLASGKAEAHLYAPEAGWVTVNIKSTKDIDNAKEIIELAYNHAASILEYHRSRRSGPK